MDAFFGPAGRLSGALAGFEPRPEQEALAAEVADAVESRRVLGVSLVGPQHSPLRARRHVSRVGLRVNPDITRIADMQAALTRAKTPMPCKSPLTAQGPLLECRPRTS